MATCPKCKAENRPEAAFCSNCGTILLSQPVVKPLVEEPAPPELVSPEPDLPESTLQTSTPLEPASFTPLPIIPDVEPAPLPGFSPRGEGAVFGGRYLYNSLVDQGEHEIHYTVTEIDEPGSPSVRACSNPECLTVHVPTGQEQENFCTVCGKSLQQGSPLLTLYEADRDKYSHQQQLVELYLAHPNIHPPIATFQEELADGRRYGLVTPFSQDLPASAELSQVSEWGLQLASGLDYLQANGVVLGGDLDPAGFGRVEGRIVWRNFNTAHVQPMLADREKINNIRVLALSLYSWITGKAIYSPDSALNPRLNRLFYQALVGEGFTNGTELAQQVVNAIKTGLSPFNLDYHVGKRTHAGRVRAVNEDSLFCLVTSRVQQGISQPAGLFAIADGMGGHATGDIASSLAIQSIAAKATSELSTIQDLTADEYASWLMQAVQAANQTVYDARQRADSDMGSTIACVLLLGTQAYLAHLGDSRIYLLRGGSILSLTTDHSVVQQLVTIGKLSAEEALHHPQRNVIYRSLGEKPQVEADIYTQDLLPGDKLLVCSDGLNSMLDDQKIQILIQESTSPQVACDYLVDAANLAGGEDNISVVLIEIISA